MAVGCMLALYMRIYMQRCNICPYAVLGWSIFLFTVITGEPYYYSVHSFLEMDQVFDLSTFLLYPPDFHHPTEQLWWWSSVVEMGQ